MEELAGNIKSLAISKNGDSNNKELLRMSQYKLKISNSSQENRRQRILAARNQARYDLISVIRKIDPIRDEEFSATPKVNEDSENDQDVERYYAKPTGFKNFIMLNEWLIDVPEDFNNTYLALPCPIGKRCLIVCSRGKTHCYARNGKHLHSFQSALPGGCGITAKRGYTMFDAIYCHTNKTYYVIDLLAWVGQSFVECETEFRFHWLHNQVKEWDHNISLVSAYNKYRFVPVPFFDCSHDSIKNMMANPLPFEGELDGVMFFHKQSHYLHGRTPLVGWLKGYMIPDVLNICVPDIYRKQKPANYMSIQWYVNKQKEDKEKRIQIQNDRKKQAGWSTSTLL